MKSGKSGMLRVVVDTNVWVSALVNPLGAPARVREALEQGRFRPIISPPLLEELEDVLVRPRIRRKYQVTDQDVAELLALLRLRSDIVPVTGTIHLCRDPDNDMVIETALRGEAAALVTRDDDLKGASDIITILEASGVRVLSVRRFLALIDGDITT